MAIHETNPLNKQITHPSFVDIIWEQGTAIARDYPDFADIMGNPGHHPGVFMAGSAEGGFIKTIDGETYYDATGYWMTESIDMQKHLSDDPEFLQRVGMMAAWAITNSEFATPEALAFLGKMHTLAPWADHIHGYMAGTLATNAIGNAMAAQVMIEEGLRPQDMKIVSLAHAFHGRAGWGLELTDSTVKTVDHQRGLAVRIDSPSVVFDEHGNIDEAATQEQVARSLAQLEEAFTKDRGVAGIMFEYPVQAEGGAYVIPRAFLEGARKICDAHKRFLALDLVQMGGKGWAFPPGTELADYVAFGKFYRVCGVLAKDPTKRGFKVDHMANGAKYGATWAGAVDRMMIALKTLSVIEEHNLWEHGNEMAEILYEDIKEMEINGHGLYPRREGTYIGINLSTREERDAFIDIARDMFHTLFLKAGETAIRISPRLDVPIEEIDYIVSVMRSTLCVLQTN